LGVLHAEIASMIEAIERLKAASGFLES